MSQTDTNHRANDTPAPALNGHRVGDPSRVFSKAGPATPIVADDHHASCEARALCTRFLANLNHQLRTELNSIVSATEMMVATELSLDFEMSASHREFVATIAESADALSLITDVIGDFSRCLALGAEGQSQESELLGGWLDEPGGETSADGVLADGMDALSRGTQDMLPKNPATGSRVFNGAANFRTRVPPDTAKQIRILLAEDHMMNQHVMMRMLARLGYTADAVCNGVEAVAALTRSPYDIVLMDCQMPELDGYEATRQIRRGGGRFRSTPIIAVTANAMEGDREKCLASGMSDYMSKPVLAQTLATTLEKWILPDAALAESASPQAGHTATYGASPSAAGFQPESSMPDEGSPKVPPPEIEDAIDAGAIETLRSMDTGDEGFMGKIIELFLCDLTERLAALKTAVAARDGRALKAIAHAVKGSCGHFGAKNLAALCRKMEQIGLQQPVPDPSEAFAELQAEAGRVRIALEETQRSSPPNSVTMEEPD